MSKNDEKIKELLGIIDTKKKLLGKKPRMLLKTNGLFKDNNHSINLNIINSIEVCLEHTAFLIRKRDSVKITLKRIVL